MNFSKNCLYQSPTIISTAGINLPKATTAINKDSAAVSTVIPTTAFYRATKATTTAVPLSITLTAANTAGRQYSHHRYLWSHNSCNRALATIAEAS
jgi:hypothetical protein